MEGRLRTGLSPSDGRRFGLVVGAAFVLLALVLLWRDRVLLAQISGGLGTALVLGGILVPAYMGPVYNAWMALALVISKVTTPIFMGIVYFVVIAPMGLVMRMFGKNPLRHKAVRGTRWHTTEPGGRDAYVN